MEGKFLLDLSFVNNVSAYLTFCFYLHRLKRGQLEIFMSSFCSFDPCAKPRR